MMDVCWMVYIVDRVFDLLDKDASCDDCEMQQNLQCSLCSHIGCRYTKLGSLMEQEFRSVGNILHF